MINLEEGIEMNDADIEQVDYGFGMAGLYFTLTNERIKAQHAQFVQMVLNATIRVVDAMAEQQAICPCYWLYSDIRTSKWRTRSRQLLKQAKELTDVPLQQRKLMGNKLLGTCIAASRTSADLMVTVLTQLGNSVDNLVKVLCNPKEEALCRLYDEMVAHWSDSGEGTTKVEEDVSKQCSRCRNGHPQAATVEGWMVNLCDEAREGEMGELVEILHTIGAGDERKAAVARYIYNLSNREIRYETALTLTHFYERYEQLLVEARATQPTAKTPSKTTPLPTATTTEGTLHPAIKGLNAKIEGCLSEHLTLQHMDELWMLLTEDEETAKRLTSESRNKQGGLNLAMYAKVIGRLSYHGLVQGSFTHLSQMLFGDIDDCNQETLRREFSSGLKMERPNDEPLRLMVDRWAHPLRSQGGQG